MTRPTLTYNINLPQSVDEILEVDFWVYNHLTASFLRPVKDPIKFASQMSIFVVKGSAEIEVNLLKMKVTAPCVVAIKPDEVMQIKYVTDDFDASFVVMSPQLSDSLLLTLHDSGSSPAMRVNPVAPVAPEDVHTYQRFYYLIESLANDHENPYRFQAILHALLSFYFEVGYKSYNNILQRHKPQEANSFRRNPLIDKFMILVQQNFKKERQITFYADTLGVTTKHLSRLLKQCTGLSAADWIRNYITLEAKVMLKSSTLSMGQIADHLNFPSQSFFAKFFKNATGMTPKQFRNSPMARNAF
jgi:AraC-like DNA-binding protein